MKKLLIALLITSATLAACLADDKVPANPQILVETTEGNFVIELNDTLAPATTAKFLEYVDSGFYDGTVFHRVIPGFMIQGGGFTPDFSKKATTGNITNESHNGLQNVRGSIAMARTADPHSASAQFFINVVDNLRLDPDPENFHGSWGYAVFGQVSEGMDVIDGIAAVATLPNGPGGAPAPVEPVIITKMSRASD